MAQRTNVYSTARVDALVASDLQDLATIGYYDDITPVTFFIQKDGLKKSLDFLDQKSATNEYSPFLKSARNLAAILDLLNFVLNDDNPQPLDQQLSNKQKLLDERDKITEFYMDMCQHLRMAYKVYGLRKPPLVAVVTRILQALVEFKNQRVLSELADNFDFGNVVIHRLFVPSKDDFEQKVLNSSSMRTVFMEFWISLSSAASPTLRKDLLTNYKVMGGFWKYLEMDRFEQLSKLFDFLLRKVLNEPTYKRATKTKILNENFLFNVRPLFDFVKAENTRDLDNDDLDDFNTFKSAFTEFMNTLVTDKERGISFPSNELGLPLTVNGISFNINNKLIYVLLTTLKPWDSYLQLQYAMKILTSNLELLPPYMQWIVSSSGGYHDPSLTSYWIGHTLLYTEILKLDAFQLKKEYISLAPLPGSILKAVLEYPNPLVQQLGLQIVQLMLRRVSQADIPQGVVEAVLNQLPPQSTLVLFLLHENKFLKITSTQILAYYERVAPGLASSSTVSLITKKLADFDFASARFSGIDLVLLDHYLLIKSNNDLKWWNKSGSENSFFTSLLKLSHLAQLRPKILRILQRLTITSLAFNRDQVIEDPLLVLLESLFRRIGPESANKLYSCIDEAISRTIKSPYKYLDQSAQNYGNLSIFVVVLFEQLKYIPNYAQEKSIHTWLEQFLRGLVIIGEPLSGILAASKDSDVSVAVNTKNLILKSRLMCKIDFAEAVIIFCKTADSKKSENALFEVATKLGQFLGSASPEDNLLFNFVTRASTWKFLGRLEFHELERNHVVACCLLSELLSQWIDVYRSSELGNFIFDTCQKQLTPKTQSVVSRFLFLLSDDQVRALTSFFDNEALVICVFKEVIKRSLQVVPNYAQLIKIESQQVSSIIRALPPRKDELDVILDNPRFAHLFEKSDEPTIQYLLTKKDLADLVLYHVAPYSLQIAEKYHDRVVGLTRSFQYWNLSLKVIAAHPNMFKGTTVVASIEKHILKSPKDAMCAEFVLFVSTGLKNFDENLSFFPKWINRAMLYVTKKFAESTTLSSSFDLFLNALGDLFLSHMNAAETVSTDIVNAQLQVTLAHAVWCTDERYLSYLNKLLLAMKTQKLDSARLLQVFITNSKMCLHSFPSTEDARRRFESALVVHSLFFMNVSVSTVSLLENVLLLYLGSVRSEDLLIKSVLIAIEKQISKSWVCLVTGWTFLSDLSREEAELVGSERLFIKDQSSFVVALQKKFINNTIDGLDDGVEVPNSVDYAEFVLFLLKCKSLLYFDTAYDPHFLLLAIVSNDELILYSGGQLTVNVSQMIGSDLFRFVVSALANESVKHIGKVILHGILTFLQFQDASYRDKNVLIVYVSSILHTLRESDHLTPVVWYIVGTFVNILGNPGHFLYDLVSRYVLSHPTFKQYELPLFTEISKGTSDNSEAEGEVYYRQVSWIIEQLEKGVSSVEDLRLLRYKSVLSWTFDLTTSKYVSGSLRNRILHLVFKIQTIGTEGTDMLITKVAGLASLATLKSSIGTETLMDELLRLNIDKLALRFSAAGSQKRVAVWAHNDVPAAAKRIHLA